ncbi:MAG: OsmC family protein [Deltaproteobacteria bacterium]|nr:OsmC family protein [Deltaproteobacteria bacterium]MCH7913630.1 OsmC family protein [Deltaproteobacteria bacterium]
MTQCASYLAIRIDKAELTVRGEFDQKGKFGLADVPSACKLFVYELTLQSPEKEERIVELLAAVERSCYATNTLRNPVEVVPQLRLNGKEVPLNLKF